MEAYLFGSARIRSLEHTLIGEARIERLLEAGSVTRCIDMLVEYGVEPVTDGAGAFDREATLLARLRSAYREVLSSAENAPFLTLWLFPYDCNNLKAAIKCFRRGVDCRDMLFDFGAVGSTDLLQAVERNDFKALSEPFQTAAAEASEAFSKTANPQWVDLILDRACYRAMLDTAQESGVELAVRLVRQKIDLTNLMICIRLLRMNSGEAGESMMRDSLLDGGLLSHSRLTDLYRAGEQVLWERLAYSAYRSFALSVKGCGATLTEVETAADNDWMHTVREARLIPYGPETLIGYLLGSEYEVRNLRIVLAGFGADLPAHVIRERIRESYV